MKPIAYKLLADTKQRAVSQIQYALRRMARHGYHGQTFRWLDENDTRQVSYAYLQYGYAFALRTWRGEGDTPCFYDYERHTWQHVNTLPAERLITCADGLLLDAINQNW